MTEKILWPAHKIRATYLDFFKSKGHKVVPSDSLIPQGDPTLLFTGAGMNQFKEYFLGVKKDLRRAASSQKCIRTGDLDRVGETPYHHSFFEMLGNFSFGDYFKEEAIEWAFELLLERFGVPRERLRVSVHQDDEEALRIWRDRIKVPENWIRKLGDDSNFWPADAIQQGPNGPCGPCSELFYDQGPSYGCGRPQCDVDCDCGRFAEIWNLVFTQYDRQDGGRLVPLAAKNIDTGSGLERLACMLQGKRNNFEIDILAPLVEDIKRPAADPQRANHAAACTIADHARAATFAIGDGVTPSNEGRGYVIRKLIRRAVWKYQKEVATGCFLPDLAARVAEIMREPYPSLTRDLSHIQVVLEGEEKRFLNTLEEGQAKLEDLITQAQKTGRKQIGAESAFKLYDTYGFPDELTVSIARTSGIGVDLEGFQKLMEEQRKRAKEASKIADSIFVAGESNPRLEKIAPSVFTGYEMLTERAKVLFLDLNGAEGWAVLDRTPFYAEKGGQVGDRGTWTWPGGKAEVLDTQWKEKWILHSVRTIEGRLTEGEAVTAEVDPVLRERTRRHHTATHILQAALRKILGPHVRQLGSLVSPDKLRFDFSHPKALTPVEIRQIEAFVNEAVLNNLPVVTELKTYDQSQQEGVLAFFGEKYEDTVRVLDVGSGLSKELCGGTHVRQTGDIGSFIIVSESSIASGTRRIEALAGLAALEYAQNCRQQLADLAAVFRASTSELKERAEKLVNKLKSLERGAQSGGAARLDIDRLVQLKTVVSGLTLVSAQVSDVEASQLRGLSDQLRAKLPDDSAVILFSVTGETVNFVVASKSTRLDAGSLTKKLAAALQGSGGGKREFAQGGGKKPELLHEVLSGLSVLVEQTIHSV
ncbi:MAG: alanine--tRNA ligase [Candidatus Omnitrophica bacterium]|nr:alanine--tRNA ligase [Candidatus Omnitrophota bacterium]